MTRNRISRDSPSSPTARSAKKSNCCALALSPPTARDADKNTNAARRRPRHGHRGTSRRRRIAARLRPHRTRRGTPTTTHPPREHKARRVAAGCDAGEWAVTPRHVRRRPRQRLSSAATWPPPRPTFVGWWQQEARGLRATPFRCASRPCTRSSGSPYLALRSSRVVRHRALCYPARAATS